MRSSAAASQATARAVGRRRVGGDNRRRATEDEDVGGRSLQLWKKCRDSGVQALSFATYG
eukprot:4226080-Pyramimonas_sp.AAC.1